MKPTGSPRRPGGALIFWVLLAAVIGMGAFYLAKRQRPEPVIVAATPPPATPMPTTPEPVIVKATPTPTPTPAPVVIATPTPAPTPPLLDAATVLRTPALWPPQILLLQPVAFPLTLNGRVVGEAKAPAGTALRVVRIYNQQVEVEYQKTRRFVPISATDLMPRALAIFRANGSVIPQTPAPTTAAAEVPAATPAPLAKEKVRVDVTAARKRIDFVRDTKSRAGQPSDSVEKCLYEIKVQNRSFGDTPALDWQSMVFVERQMLGEKKDKDTIERISGSGKLKPLTRSAALQTVSTGEFELHKRDLTGGFYYPNGGREKVEDNVVGVWIKVLLGGDVVGEFTNPSTVTKRGWEGK